MVKEIKYEYKKINKIMNDDEETLLPEDPMKLLSR